MDQMPSATTSLQRTTLPCSTPQNASEPHSISSVTSDISPAFPSEFFYPSTVATKILYAFLTHIMRATCTSNVILWFHHPNNIWTLLIG